MPDEDWIGLGEPVWHDGGPKPDQFAADTLSKSAEWAPFCLEVAAVPRS